MNIIELVEARQFTVKKKRKISMQQVVKKLSFIGLGKMGRPLAEKLLAAGYPVTGHDKYEKVGKLFSGKIGHTLRDTLNEADLVITMLPSGKEVEEVLLKNNNFLITSKDCVFLDMSSSSPFDTISLGERLKGRGGLLDGRLARLPSSGVGHLGSFFVYAG